MYRSSAKTWFAEVQFWLWFSSGNSELSDIFRLGQRWNVCDFSICLRLAKYVCPPVVVSSISAIANWTSRSLQSHVLFWLTSLQRGTVAKAFGESPFTSFAFSATLLSSCVRVVHLLLLGCRTREFVVEMPAACSFGSSVVYFFLLGPKLLWSFLTIRRLI